MFGGHQRAIKRAPGGAIEVGEHQSSPQARPGAQSRLGRRSSSPSGAPRGRNRVGVSRPEASIPVTGHGGCAPGARWPGRSEPMSAATLVFLNRKGGVGKTSTTFHLAGAFARSGRRVLLLDTDPQASLTQGFFGPEWTEAVPPGNTIAALFGEDYVPDPVGLIVPTGFAGIDILPGSEHLNRFNLPGPEGDPRQTSLRDLIAEVRDAYDAILIDCPPNLCLCSWSALAAGDGVVVPVQPEDFGPGAQEGSGVGSGGAGNGQLRPGPARLRDHAL